MASVIDKELEACKTQAKWMENADYGWESKPTVAKSKHKGTCVTFVACVLQRIGVLAEGKALWHNGKGYGTGTVTGANDKMTVTYYENPSIKSIINKIKPGDIILLDDNKSGVSGSGGHIFIIDHTSGNDVYVWDKTNSKTKLTAHKYDNSRKVRAIVKVKTATNITTTTTNWVDNANAWAKKIANDNTWHYKKWSSDSKTHECPVCKNYPVTSVDTSSSSSTSIKGYHGWNCIGFASAVWHHGGGLKNKCSPSMISNSVGDKMLQVSDSEALKIAKDKVGLSDIQVIRNKNGISDKLWQAGDICLQFSGNTYTHMFYYMGNKEVADAIGSNGRVSPKNQIAIRSWNSYSAKIIIRYTGPNPDGTTYSPGSSTPKLKTVVKKYSMSQQDVKDGACAWAKVIAADNSFHYGKGDAAHHYGCYFCKTQKAKQGHGILDPDKTYCCNPFVFSAFAHGGGEKDMLDMCKRGKNSNTKIFHDNKHFKDIGLPGIKSLQAGDVLWRDASYGDKGSGCHYALYVGNSQLAEAAGGDDNKRNSSKWNNSIRVRTLSSYGSFKHVSRYIGGTYGGPIDIPGQDGLITQVEDNGIGIDLRQAISKLYSSENFERVVQEEEESRSRQIASKFTSQLQEILNNVNFDATPTENSNAFAEYTVNNAIKLSEFEKDKPKKILQGRSTQLLSYPTLVEAPTIVLDFNGIKIGGYGNTGDKYPNYLTSMTVKKINGRINQYTINLSYQIRFGEDPNFIDKLISRTGYTNPLKILYGDSNFPSGYYKEESAVITDIRHSEEFSSYRINYTISAISSVGVARTSLTTFDSKTDRPSNVIYDLLYDSGEISKSLIELFPGMRNKTLVASRNLIPTNDNVVNIGGMANVSPLTYLSYLVASMNSNNNSTYYLNLIDNSNSEYNGSYFEIKEVINYNNRNIQDYNIVSNYFELDIGYPSNNFITNFQICNNNYWSLVYNYAGDIPKFQYGIDDNGDLISRKTNALYTTNRYNESSLISENWWKQVTEFPISAKVTLKGLINPAILMSYIKVNALFYGQRDMASGLYVVTQQEDSISGSGYSTELTLLRVAGE